MRRFTKYPSNYVKANTTVEDTSYNQHLIRVSKEDKQYILNNLNKSHKAVGMGEAGDPGYYVSEFEPAYGLYLWTSDAGMRILGDNGIEYEEVKKAIESSTNPFYDRLSEKDKRFVRNTERQMADATEEVTPDNICELAMKLLPPEDIDHHETDLYIRKTPESTKLINKMKYKDSGLLTTFVDNIDHAVWYDLPFCYSPEWERRLGGRY